MGRLVHRDGVRVCMVRPVGIRSGERDGLGWVGLGGNEYDSPFLRLGRRGRGAGMVHLPLHFGLHIALFYRSGLVKLNS